MVWPVTTITRFAPSPSGHLHLGHAYAALVAHAAARATGGRFLVRIEDIDSDRCRPEFEAAIFEDLAWLGLAWDMPVLRQSARARAYADALARLGTLGLLYPCFCTRAEIRAEIASSPSAPHGPEGPLYPGTCRVLTTEERAARIAAGTPHALRLDARRAVERAGTLTWTDADAGQVIAAAEDLGDVVLARAGIATSYHLAVVVDDAFQGVTLVTRGADLFHATHVHRLLQALLDLPTPRYRHHRLITGVDGKRLATRDGATALRVLRSHGWTARDVHHRVGMGPSG
jgi:glutamyl-Q tRNA(Asp) synthetase